MGHSIYTSLSICQPIKNDIQLQFLPVELPIVQLKMKFSVWGAWNIFDIKPLDWFNGSAYFGDHPPDTQTALMETKNCCERNNALAKFKQDFHPYWLVTNSNVLVI